MNAQQSTFNAPYPPPSTPQYTYHYPYPPQPAPSQQHHLPPYQYHAQPILQQVQQHQQANYLGSLQSTPQGQSSRQPQQNVQNAGNTSNAPPRNDPGAPPPQPTSPAMDQFDRDLMDALSSNDQPPPEEDDDQQEQDHDDENEPIFKLPPPPETSYPSEAELEKGMHAWSLEHGYEMVRRAAKKNTFGMIYKRYYHCSKHGFKSSGKPPEVRKRAHRKSNRMGCPMSLACVAVDPTNPDGDWQIKHRKTHHNHPASEGMSLVGHRRRAREGSMEKAVDGLFSIGTSTAQVLVFLQKTQPIGLFTRTDVANMKLKWRKFGSCGVKPLVDGALEKHRAEGSKLGVTSACIRCRTRKQGCSSERPSCAQCRRNAVQCSYQHEARTGNQEAEEGAATSQRDLTPPTATQPQQHGQQTQQTQPTQQTPDPTNPNMRVQRTGRPSTSQAAATKEILDELRSFQAEHITRERLTLQSSSVEMLAQSSCGTGESYKNVPVLSSISEWPHFRDAMIEAAMKENTHDVLTGNKPEPEVPSKPDGKPVDVETWNEYTKQLAIYNRRNDLLLPALWTHLAPNLRTRVQAYRKASLIWSTLEDLCLPRGSSTAFQLYLDLHSITLDTSADLKDYIHRLTSTYNNFKLLRLNTSPPPPNRLPSSLPTARTGGEAVPEEMVCFLFLRNLGPEWRRWVEGLVATNNIGGFGTGERLGLRELGKRAEAYSAMQRQGL